MIEPTDEMVQAAQAATCGAESDECMRDALVAAFALIERDYEPRRCDEPSWTAHRCTKPRGHDGGHYHRWSGVVWP